jgi:hypothetical protein
VISRRRFVGALAGLTAVTALAGSRIKVPEFKEAAAATDFDTANLRVKCTERYSAGFTDWRGVFGNAPSSSAELNVKALEDMIRELTDNAMLTCQPTRLTVPPRLEARARHVIEHKPTLFERFAWWAFGDLA